MRRKSCIVAALSLYVSPAVSSDTNEIPSVTHRTFVAIKILTYFLDRLIQSVQSASLFEALSRGSIKKINSCEATEEFITAGVCVKGSPLLHTWTPSRRIWDHIRSLPSDLWGHSHLNHSRSSRNLFLLTRIKVRGILSNINLGHTNFTRTSGRL